MTGAQSQSGSANAKLLHLGCSCSNCVDDCSAANTELGSPHFSGMCEGWLAQVLSKMPIVADPLGCWVVSRHKHQVLL